MKKIKFIALFMAVIMLIGVLAGCGNSSGRKLTGTVTLKEFLDSGPKVAFWDNVYEGINKDERPEKIYLFEDGKVYYVQSYSEYGGETDETKLTWGEISKMSDEELLELARKYKTLHSGLLSSSFTSDNDIFTGDWVGSNTTKDGIPTRELIHSKINIKDEDVRLYCGADGNLYIRDDNGSYTLYDGRYGELSVPKYTYEAKWYFEMPTGEYTLHIDTDNTGNRTEQEQIYVELSERGNDIEQYNIMTRDFQNTPSSKATVYDSTFTVLYVNGHYGLVFRTGEDLTITLDNPGDKGVEVD